MNPLTLHPLTETTTLAACGFCHQIKASPAEARGHLQAVHPRRTAIAEERRGSA